MKAMGRAKRFSVHLNVDTQEALKRLADRLELTMAGALRVAILEVAERQMTLADVAAVAAARAESRTLFEELQGRIDYLESRLDEITTRPYDSVADDGNVGNLTPAVPVPAPPDSPAPRGSARPRAASGPTARRVGQGIPLAPAHELLAEEHMVIDLDDHPGN